MLSRRVSEHLPLFAVVGLVVAVAIARNHRKQKAKFDRFYTITTEYVVHLHGETDGVHWELVKRDPLLGTVKKVVGTLISYGVEPSEKKAREAAKAAYDEHIAAT